MSVHLLSDENCQEIYETLLERSQRSFDKYNRARALPRLKIPGELAFFLDDLLEHAAEMGAEPEEALAAVVDYGMVAWYAGLDKKTQKRLGLPQFGKADAKPNAAPAKASEVKDKPRMEHPKCSFPGCEKNRFVRGHGFCGKHWKHWKVGKIKSAKEYSAEA